MQRIDFLREEHASVARALREALRHDYGPERSSDFYSECESRLATIADAIEANPGMDPVEVANQLEALASVGSRVALLERSHLGEFSWPFAYAIREIAERLFREDEASGPSTPIVHVVAEGIGYHIWDDDLDSMFRHRIMIVAFPRHLRHHVLLHTIFGHELCHPALKGGQAMDTLFDRVLPAMVRGPLRDEGAFVAWLGRGDAPERVRRLVAAGLAITDEQLQNWCFELLCDLFGLVLFGPAFAAAHRMILEPLHPPPEDYSFSSATHPPYPLRKRLIADAMRLLDWLRPTVDEEGPERGAEEKLLAYAGGDAPDAWNRLVDDADLREMLDALAEIFAPFPGLAYSRPDGAKTAELLGRLVRCRPPIAQAMGGDGVPCNDRVPLQHCLYAGWAFWFGMDGLRTGQLARRPDTPKLDFLQVNRLCEQALLQQRAIDAILDAAA